MVVNIHTRVSELIREDKKIIDALVAFNPHFKKLKNPVLRKVLASRVTIKDASRIAGVEIDVLLDVIEKTGFSVERLNKERNDENKPGNFSKEFDVELDVRPILEGGVDPFKAIIEKLDSISSGKTLKIINSFEPLPLISLLSAKGYLCHSEKVNEGEYHAYINKVSQLELGENHQDELGEFEQRYRSFAGRIVYKDVRDLEMPLPMQQILTAMEVLPENHCLFVDHKRIPQFLLPQLNDRGFSYDVRSLNENHVQLLFYKN